MFEKFPYSQEKLRLCVADFNLFSKSFGQILKYKLPTFCEIYFYGERESFRQSLPTDSVDNYLVSLFQEIQDGQKAFGIDAGILLLPFHVEDGCVVSVITDTDPIFINKVGPDWLFEVAGAAEREFILLKEARVDGLTGLLNLSNLQSLLDNAGSVDDLTLILLELLPKRFLPPQIQRHLTKCTSLLKNFVNDGSVLHYIGNCTFGLVLKETAKYGENVIVRSLVAYLRKEGCHRVYAGTVKSSAIDGKNAGIGLEHNELLDAAWAALCHARKLGPFSFCNYKLLVHPEQHPLAPPDRNLIRKLGRKWAGVDRFCLIEFVVESGDKNKYDALIPLLDRGNPIVYKEELFLFLCDGEIAEIRLWLNKVIQAGSKALGGAQILAGIGCYPLLDCSKAGIVWLCRKALLHASYFKESCVVVFDAVSLNISGDVYFSEGNLTRAAKEYRQGLKLNDRDVNLYNSLGVTLAQMDKLSAAYNSFQKALAIDPANFMSFYNLGLLEQHRKNNSAALDFFKRAQQTFDREDGELELLQDLELQMGLLSCDVGENQEAIHYLNSWYDRNEQLPNSGHIFYYLGKAYFGLNNNRSAMKYLQRALQFDEFDARAMSLLGYIYAKEKQGNDIALSLCLKSVELEPSEIQYKFQLGEVCFRAGLFQEAKENVYKCLRIKTLKAQSQFLLGEIYASDGKMGRARTWFTKVMLQRDASYDLHILAEKRLQSLRRSNKKIIQDNL